MKKRIIPISISVVVILALALAGLHYARAGNGPGGMGIPIKPDYSLVPIYTMQGSQAYMNAQATPLLFIDRTDNSGKFAQAVQGALQESASGQAAGDGLDRLLFAGSEKR